MMLSNRHLVLKRTRGIAEKSSVCLCVCIFQTYVKSQDKAFAAATIQAIGRCATNISEVTDTCLNGLVLLLSNRDGNLTAQKFIYSEVLADVI